MYILVYNREGSSKCVLYREVFLLCPLSEVLCTSKGHIVGYFMWCKLLFAISAAIYIHRFLQNNLNLVQYNLGAVSTSEEANIKTTKTCLLFLNTYWVVTYPFLLNSRHHFQLPPPHPLPLLLPLLLLLLLLLLLYSNILPLSLLLPLLPLPLLLLLLHNPPRCNWSCDGTLLSLCL